MAGRRGGSRKLRELITGELDLMPLMNVFLVVIPLLLFSAVFIQVSVIEMNQSASAAAASPVPESIELTILIHPEGYVVQAEGFPPRAIPRSEASAETADSGGAGEATMAELALSLGEIAASHPDNHDVQIVPEATTHYEEIIAVMDVARAAGLSQASLAGEAAGGR